MTRPAFVAAGAGATGTGSTLVVPSVSGLSGGEHLILQVWTTIPEQVTPFPPGYDGDNLLLFNQQGTGVWIFQRGTKAAAGSDGGVTVSFSGSSRKAARIYAFSDVGIAQSALGVARAISFGTGTTVSAPTIPVGGPNALALAFLQLDGERAVAAFSGETGGDWTEAVAEYSPGGSGVTMQMQTAEPGLTGISGGSLTIAGSEPWLVQPIMLLGANNYTYSFPPGGTTGRTSATAVNSAAATDKTIAATRDLSTVPDMSAHGKEVVGAEAVAERLYDRLTTRRGTYPWWPDYGTNVRDFLLAKTPQWRIDQSVQIECEKDEQVLTAIVNSTINNRASGQTISIDVRFVTKSGEFVFTMSVSEAASQYISVSRAA